LIFLASLWLDNYHATLKTTKVLLYLPPIIDQE